MLRNIDRTTKMNEYNKRSIPCNFRVTLKKKEWLAKRRRQQSKFVRNFLSEHPDFEIRKDPKNITFALLELHLYVNEIKLIQKYGKNASLTMRSLISAAMEMERSSTP